MAFQKLVPGVESAALRLIWLAMEFTGHLMIVRPGVVERIRAELPERLARDGFTVTAAAPLRAKRALSWFQRLRREVQHTGRRLDLSLPMATAVRFELPFADTGTLSYTVSIPHHTRAIGSLVTLATLTAYLLEGFFPAFFIAVVGSGLIGIALHYAMRQSVVRYLGLSPGQYREHRLSMG